MTNDPPAKRVRDLTRALYDAVEEMAAADPRAAREAVVEARVRLDDAEGIALRAALARCQWRVKPAADLLGFPRHSALQKLLEPGRRHEALGEEVARQRDATGYHLGRPPTLKTPTPTEPPRRQVPPAGQKAPGRRGRSATHE